jgi:hypothetical protein
VVHVVSQSSKMEADTSNTTNEAANIFAQL